MKPPYFKIAAAIFLGCLQAISAVGLAWLLKLIVDIVTSSNSSCGLYQFSMIAFAYYIGYLLLYYFSNKLHLNAMKQIRIFMKEKLLVGLLWASEKTHRNRTLGKVLSVFQYQVDMIEDSCFEPTMKLISDITMMVVSFSSMIFLQWQIAMGSVLLLILYLLVTNGINRKLKALQTARAGINGMENNELVTAVEGFFTAKDYGQEKYFLSRYATKVKVSADLSFRYDFTANMLSIISSNLEFLAVMLIIFAGGMMMKYQFSGITAGGVLGITQLLGSMMDPVGSIGPSIAHIKSTKEIRQELKAFAADGAFGKAAEWTASLEPLPKLEKLSLRQVSFSYDGQPILKRISFDFFAGKKYAIIGESGSGKTTLLSLFLKQMDPDDGVITWNDIPYSVIKKGTLLLKLGYVAQDPTIFHKSVRENITGGTSTPAGRNPTEKDCEDRLFQMISNLCLLREGLSPEEFLALPANELSGGEQKRMAYARALYKECDALFIDEVLSALDEVTAQSVERDMLKTQQQIVIHVTHRLRPELFSLYDQILTVSHGQLVPASTIQDQ